jgi:hypothetical protein
MKNHKSINSLLVILLATLFSSCTETYPLLTNTYEEAIVIEATLTNEFKNQEVKITKTARFEDEGVETEKGATVIVKDNAGNEFLFAEKSGVYVSQSPFQISPDQEYTLQIMTSDKKIYQSSAVKSNIGDPIQSITPAVVTNKDNETGVQINVSSYNPSGTSKYYRYEYEETYKIVTPRWSPLKLRVITQDSVALVPNSDDTKICYSSKKSTDIILANTVNQTEDRVNLPIRFINQNNYIIGHRYSILVKQYIENIEAYTFHKNMRDLSSSSSVLSPKQPGVINGNIKCISDSNTKVIGYFDVASVSSKRIFFNYTDLFPQNNTPSYITTCEDLLFKFCFSPLNPLCRGNAMIKFIEQKEVTYIEHKDILYTLVTSECGDCTTFSSNVIPSFWTN